jgi:hypothetical protein
MTEQAERVAQFRREVAGMGLRDPVTRREQALLRLGAVGMVVGPIIAIVSYFLSHNTINALQQRDAIVIAVIGLSITVVGSALFLRYSFGRMLRFWLARFAFEQHGRDAQEQHSPQPSPSPASAAGPASAAEAAPAAEAARPLKAH